MEHPPVIMLDETNSRLDPDRLRWLKYTHQRCENCKPAVEFRR